MSLNRLLFGNFLQWQLTQISLLRKGNQWKQNSVAESSNDYEEIKEMRNDINKLQSVK